MRSRKSVVSVFSLLAVFLLVPGCAKEKEEQVTVIRPVRYEQVFSSGGARVRSFSGVSQAGQESRLSFKVAGTIQTLAIDVGDKVTAGQLLAKIDPQDYQLQVEEAEAALARQEAQSRNSSAGYDRVRGLYENGHASLQDLDQARASFDMAASAVRSAQKGLEQARNQLNYTQLLAPVAGSIAQVEVEVNENVTAGKTVVLLTSGSRSEVKVDVPEILITKIVTGEPAEVGFDALPGTRFPATITEVSVASVGSASMFPVTVQLDKSNDDIRPGMAAEVSFRFTSPGSERGIIVPTSAVGEDRDGRFVYLLKNITAGEATANRHPVTVGEITGEGLVILDGVVDGDYVVTAGVSKLTEGQKVKLLMLRGSE